jgi:hypothetical protein
MGQWFRYSVLPKWLFILRSEDFVLRIGVHMHFVIGFTSSKIPFSLAFIGVIASKNVNQGHFTNAASLKHRTFAENRVERMHRVPFSDGASLSTFSRH